MSSFGRYFKYHFKNTAIRIPIIAAIAFLFTTILSVDLVSRRPGDYIYPDTTIYYQYLDGAYSVLGCLAGLLVVLAFLLPALEMSGFKNRRNLDTMYSFPVSRVKLFGAHYLNGLLQMFIVYTVVYVASACRMLPYGDIAKLHYLIPAYFFMLLSGISLYSVSMFGISQANNSSDSGMFALAYWLLPTAIFAIRDFMTERFGLREETLESLGFLPVFSLADSYADSMNYARHELINSVAQFDWTFATRIKYDWATFKWVIMWAVIALLCVAGFFWQASKQRTEKVGGISESVFGYAAIIPIFGLTLMTMINDPLLGILVSCALMLIGYFIYRRGVRLKLPDILSLAITPAVFMILFQFFNASAQAIS